MSDKKPEPFSAEEQRAAEVVPQLLQAPTVERPSRHDGPMYDFNVFDDAGVVVASVEVTILANQQKHKTWDIKTLEGHRRGPGLQHGWSVTFSKIEKVRLNDAMPKVHAVLRDLEAAGTLELDVPRSGVDHDDDEDDDDEHRAAVATLKVLGVVAVNVLEGGEAGTIMLGSINPDFRSWTTLEDAIEERARKKARQLGKAAADVERILFVWIDKTRQDLLAQLRRWSEASNSGPPPRTIDLPDVVDTVIVGTLTEEDSNRFWRWPGFSQFDVYGEITE